MKRSVSKIIFWVVSLTLLIQMGLLSSASAAVMPARSLGDLASAADVICTCQVHTLHSEWDSEQNMIITIVTLEVEEYLKGSGEPTLQIQVPGGIIGDQGLKVTGAPVFQKDERSVLFLKSGRVDRLGGQRHHVVSWAQGKFRIETDPESGDELIDRDLRGVHFMTPRTSEGGKPPRTLSELKAAIHSAVISEIGTQRIP